MEQETERESEVSTMLGARLYLLINANVVSKSGIF